MPRGRSKRGGGGREYPRTARVSQLVREILAETLTELDDPRLGLVTVIEVRVDNELDRALVWVEDASGTVSDEELLEALDEHRGRLRREVGDQARLRKTPALEFRIDEVGRAAARIDELLGEPGPPPSPDDRS